MIAVGRLERTPAARISTFTGPVANADGSYDLYFGPKPIAGKERILFRRLRTKAGSFCLGSMARKKRTSTASGNLTIWLR